MKQLTKLLSLCAVALVSTAGCGKSEAPTKEKSGIQTVYAKGSADPLVLFDFDGDRTVDGIKRLGVMHFVYIAKDFENGPGVHSTFTQTMTPELREAATRAYQATEDFGDEITKSNQ